MPCAHCRHGISFQHQDYFGPSSPWDNGGILAAAAAAAAAIAVGDEEQESFDEEGQEDEQLHASEEASLSETVEHEGV